MVWRKKPTTFMTRAQALINLERLIDIPEETLIVGRLVAAHAYHPAQLLGAPKKEIPGEGNFRQMSREEKYAHLERLSGISQEKLKAGMEAWTHVYKTLKTLNFHSTQSRRIFCGFWQGYGASSPFYESFAVHFRKGHDIIAANMPLASVMGTNTRDAGSLHEFRKMLRVVKSGSKSSQERAMTEVFSEQGSTHLPLQTIMQLTSEMGGTVPASQRTQAWLEESLQPTLPDRNSTPQVTHIFGSGFAHQNFASLGGRLSCAHEAVPAMTAQEVREGQTLPSSKLETPEHPPPTMKQQLFAKHTTDGLDPKKALHLVQHLKWRSIRENQQKDSSSSDDENFHPTLRSKHGVDRRKQGTKVSSLVDERASTMKEHYTIASPSDDRNPTLVHKPESVADPKDHRTEIMRPDDDTAFIRKSHPTPKHHVQIPIHQNVWTAHPDGNLYPPDYTEPGDRVTPTETQPSQLRPRSQRIFTMHPNVNVCPPGSKNPEHNAASAHVLARPPHPPTGPKTREQPLEESEQHLSADRQPANVGAWQQAAEKLKQRLAEHHAKPSPTDPKVTGAQLPPNPQPLPTKLSTKKQAYEEYKQRLADRRANIDSKWPEQKTAPVGTAPHSKPNTQTRHQTCQEFERRFLEYRVKPVPRQPNQSSQSSITQLLRGTTGSSVEERQFPLLGSYDRGWYAVYMSQRTEPVPPSGLSNGQPPRPLVVTGPYSKPSSGLCEKLASLSKLTIPAYQPGRQTGKAPYSAAAPWDTRIPSPQTQDVGLGNGERLILMPRSQRGNLVASNYAKALSVEKRVAEEGNALAEKGGAGILPVDGTDQGTVTAASTQKGEQQHTTTPAQEQNVVSREDDEPNVSAFLVIVLLFFLSALWKSCSG